MLALLAAAPLQCPARRPAEVQREESPGEALWALSERFAARGEHDAQRGTLRYLVERHPSSRFAERARQALADAGAP